MNKEEFTLRLRQYNETVLAKADKAVFSRQRDEDVYKDLYENGLIVKPPYDFSFLRSLYEESDVLQSCVSAMVRNIVGMGYTFVYLGDDCDDIPSEAEVEEEKLKSFFSEVNDSESWTDVLVSTWEDYEVMGCAAVEIIRNFSNEIMFMYYHPVENLRKVAAADGDYIDVDVRIKRDGKVISTRANTFFRRYVARLANGNLRYYKSFGDPRPLRVDGTYSSNSLLASELLWIENKKGVLRYGLPRWIGSTFDIAGRRDAQVLNWDALRSQGISPMAILVNGRLSDDSWDEIWNMIMGSKGVENFNKIWVLQVAATPTAVGASNSADVKIQDLSSAQKTDEMFVNYLKGTEERIRQSFRIPAGFLGGTGAYSYGTLKVAKLLGEEQVFGPERHLLDNKINRLILRNGFNIWSWKYKTKAAEVAGPEEIRQAISSMVSSGAISINNAVRLASDALGREFSPFPEVWANYPLPLVTKILDKFGTIDGIEDITGAGAAPPELIDIIPTTRVSPSEEDTGQPQSEDPPPEEDTVLELSEGQTSPFVGRGAVWAAAPRHTIYAYNKLRTMLSGAFSQGISVALEDAAKYMNLKTTKEMADRIINDIKREAASGISSKEITDIFASTIHKIHVEAKNIIVAREKNTRKAEAIPNFPTNWEMNWNLENQEVTNYFSKAYSLYLSKYVSQESGYASAILKDTLESVFINQGISPDQKYAIADLRSCISYLSGPITSANDTYLKMMVNTAVSRAQNLGSLMTMSSMGVVSYMIAGPSDAKTCQFCLAMLNRVANVKKDYDYWKLGISIHDSPQENPSIIKESSLSWRYQYNPEELFNLSTSQIQATGPVHPPFHPNCRHTIVPHEYKVPVPVTKPVVESPVQDIASTISPQQSVSSPLMPPEQTPLTEGGVRNFIKAYQDQYKYLQNNVHTFERVTRETHVDESTYSLTVYKDPNTGETWLYKQEGKKASQAEALAYQIGQLINPGDRVPVFSGDLAQRIGHYSGTFQRYIPKELVGAYKLEMSGSLTSTQYQQLMKEEVVDQFLGNWDTHKKNFLLGKDGRVIFIDKGQSFKFYPDDLSDSYWGYRSSAKTGTVYSELEYKLGSKYSSLSGHFNVGDTSFDPKDTLAPVLSNIDKLFSTGVTKNLVTKMIKDTVIDSQYASSIINGLKERASVVNSKMDSLYQSITGDSEFRVSEKASGKVRRIREKSLPVMSAIITEMIAKIFPDVSNEYKGIFSSAYEKYSGWSKEKLSDSAYFASEHKEISKCLGSWEGSSSSPEAILLKGLASKLEGLGDILLNSRQGEQPYRWTGVADWYKNEVRPNHSWFPDTIEEMEKKYIAARAHTQAYLRKAYPNGVPILYRGAKLSEVRNLLVDPSTIYPVEVREQTLASFSRSKEQADRFGTNDRQREGYTYNIKRIPYEDVAFTDAQLTGSYQHEQELIIRSKKGRKITKEQLSIIKNEMVRRMLLCSNEEWQEYLQKKQTPLSASVLDLSRRLLKSYVSSYIKGKG